MTKMRKQWIGRIWAISLFAASPVMAGEPQVSWLCEAGAGRWALNGVDVAASKAISGSIEFKQRNGGTKWASSALINFRHNMDDKRLAGIKFYFASDRDKFPMVAIKSYGAKDWKVLGQLSMSGPIPFSFSIDEQGLSNFVIGSQVFMEQGATFAGVIGQISCASSSVNFANLDHPVIDY
ncbi:MAG: hypothetical protein ABW169_06880 [Sphingobium sp.]